MGIQERHGIDKALDYLIGEKVYNLVDTLYAAHKIAQELITERPQRKLGAQ